MHWLEDLTLLLMLRAMYNPGDVMHQQHYMWLGLCVHISVYFRGVLVRHEVAKISTHTDVRACAASLAYTLTWQFFPDTGGAYVLIDVVTSHTRLDRETLRGPTSTRTFVFSDCACAQIQKPRK